MSIKNINKTRLFFLIIIFAELFSFLGYFWPIGMKMAFLFVIALGIWLAFKNPKNLIYLIFIELIIGSKGYLLYFDNNGFMLSARISLWLIAMFWWLSKAIRDYREFKFSFEKYASLNFFFSKYFKYFFLLFIFVLIALLNGYARRNDVGSIFFDFNGWLFFLFALPSFALIVSAEDRGQLLRIGYLSSVWLCLKTLILLFIFSHNTGYFSLFIYKWVRITGVGEITLIQNGFYRIFFQSHIFALIGFFIIFYLLLSQAVNLKNILLDKALRLKFLVLSLFLSTVLLSFSRSFWLAGVLTFIFLLFVIYKKYGLKKIGQAIIIFLSLFITGILIIVLTAKFPYPKPSADFNAGSLFSQRASQFTNESAVSSRWSLLPKIMSEIKQRYVLGGGFGSTVTYKSADPRVLEANPDGMFTTYAFEWGWLDVWLKLGFFGLAVYIVLLLKLLYGKISPDNNLSSGFNLGIIILILVSFFTPYLNHPLGISYLIFVALWLDSSDKNKTLAIK